MTPRHKTDRSKRLWANSAGDVIGFLTNVLVILGEIVEPLGIVKEGPVEKYINTITKRLFAFFDKHNIAISATIGTYFRYAFQLKKGLEPSIEFTNDDFACVEKVIHSIEPEANVAELLNKFVENNISARNAHADLLMTLLFYDIENELYANAKDKWTDALKDFILSAFYVVEFLNTPYSILHLEHESSPDKKISAIDLQFKTAKNALLGAVNAITNPDSFRKAVKSLHSRSYRSLPGKSREALTEIKVDLAKFQGCYGIEEAHFHYKEIATENEELKIHLEEQRHEIERLNGIVSMIQTPEPQPSRPATPEKVNDKLMQELPVISQQERALKIRFLTDLEKRIKELDKKKYGSVVKRAAKIVALSHLRDAVSAYMETASFEQQLMQFNRIYGNIIDEQLRDGFWARIYTPRKTTTRELLDKYFRLLPSQKMLVK